MKRHERSIPENQLLWRMNRRRLEIESLRDSMLAAAGRLDLTAGGVPFALTAQPSVPRRSVYGFIERGRIPGMLNAFDFASPDQHAPMRFVTTVPQQALFFLNSPFVAEQARHAVAAGNPRSGHRSRKDPIDSTAPSSAATRRNGRWRRACNSCRKRQDRRPMPRQSSPWQYGVGEYHADAGRVASFTPFPMFVPDRWQGGPVLPAAHFGKAVLAPAGGEPGERPNQAVIRRWISPVSGKINIEGTLRHGQPAVPYGDGVRGRIVSSRHGELASWSVNGSSAETKLNGITVEKGDTIDFIVDARARSRERRVQLGSGDKARRQTWNAQRRFRGPAAGAARCLGALRPGAARNQRVRICGLRETCDETIRDLFLTRREMLSRCGMGMGAGRAHSLLGDTGNLRGAQPAMPSIRSRRRSRRCPPRRSASCTCS